MQKGNVSLPFFGAPLLLVDVIGAGQFYENNYFEMLRNDEKVRFGRRLMNVGRDGVRVVD